MCDVTHKKIGSVLRTLPPLDYQKHLLVQSRVERTAFSDKN